MPAMENMHFTRAVLVSGTASIVQGVHEKKEVVSYKFRNIRDIYKYISI